MADLKKMNMRRPRTRYGVDSAIRLYIIKISVVSIFLLHLLVVSIFNQHLLVKIVVTTSFWTVFISLVAILPNLCTKGAKRNKRALKCPYPFLLASI